MLRIRSDFTITQNIEIELYAKEKESAIKCSTNTDFVNFICPSQQKTMVGILMWGKVKTMQCKQHDTRVKNTQQRFPGMQINLYNLKFTTNASTKKTFFQFYKINMALTNPPFNYLTAKSKTFNKLSREGK